MNKPRFALLCLLVAAVAASRLAPHAPNFTPVAALAVFGVATFEDLRAAFAVPLLGLLASDAVIGSPDLLAVYGSFALVGSLGLLLRRRRGLLRTLWVTLGGAVLFFVASNLAVWGEGRLYPRTIDGLVACYVAAIPFFRATLTGDLLYSALLFGVLAVAERLWPALARTAGSRGSAALPA